MLYKFYYVQLFFLYILSLLISFYLEREMYTYNNKIIKIITERNDRIQTRAVIMCVVSLSWSL